MSDEATLQVAFLGLWTERQEIEVVLWKIVLHVVNHATHHRGQVSGFLRAMGVRPPSLDLTTYYRGQR